MTFSKRNARRLLCLSAATIVVPLAAAQQTAPGPVLTPAPERSPAVTTLPGVTSERFTLGTPTPAPVVVPSPVPSPTPTRAATPTPRATATARSAPTPTPSAQPTSEASSTPVAPLAAPPPQVAPTITATIPATKPSQQTPGWLWMLAGAGITLLGLAAALLLRRRRAEPEAQEPQRVDLPPPLPAPAPTPAMVPAPIAAAPANEPFDVQILPRRIEVNPQHALLEIELQIVNLQPGAAENVRIDITMISASPDQDRQLVAYHASRLLPEVVQPFDLGPGAAQRLTAALTLERDQVHVIDVGGRPMFVPLIMIDIRWRSGISLRRFGADFMVGIAGQGDKLGPIWLDRPQQAARLATTRYLSRPAQ